ncbi:hypothetical protein CR513_27427, partial [Mucuna pruriens]
MCSMIIEGGSFTNVTSTTLVEKLNLQIAKHPSGIGKLKVHKQVSMPIAIGKYKDEVLCNVKITLTPLSPKQVFEDQIKMRKENVRNQKNKRVRDLYNKLHRLYQRSKSVEDYYKQVYIMRAQVEESQEATMARFLHGLNREIQDIKDTCLEHHLTLVIKGRVERRGALERLAVLKKGMRLKETEKRRESHHHLIPLGQAILSVLSA